MSQHRLDIFALLHATDCCDGDWLERQPEDTRKTFAPAVAMRWAATVADGPDAAYMLWAINERVNTHLFSLHKHPDLAYRLLASCGLGRPHKHSWIAPPARAGQPTAAHRLLFDWYPEASDAEISWLLSQFDRAEFSRLVADSGIQSGDAKDVMKAYDKICSRAQPEKTDSQQ